eukprot:2710004-Prymnesium_polylepis.1
MTGGRIFVRQTQQGPAGGAVAAKTVEVTKSAFGATHSFAESETIAFTRHINEVRACHIRACVVPD